MAPFEINCNIDIDGDGKLDCVAAGRMGTVVAFNPRNGKALLVLLLGRIYKTPHFWLTPPQRC